MLPFFTISGHDHTDGEDWRREGFINMRLVEVPSGNLLQFAIENGHRNSEFSH
jgi:hypothetical protein